MHYFLHREMYDRIFTAVQHRNPGPWGWLKVYFPTIVLGSLPWWPNLAPAAFAGLRGRAPKSPARRPDIRLMLWLWFAIPLVVFCVAQSRLPAYVLPLFLPLSLLLARGLELRIDLHKASQCVALAIWIVALLAIKGTAAYAVKQPDRDNLIVARTLSASATSGAYSAVVFVQATAKAYDIEERTPWGIRLYLDKPVYAVAWLAPEGPGTLCRALRSAGSALVVIAPGLAPARTQIAGALARCTRSLTVDAGTWRRHALMLARE
jgi:4-amino-4-deoxy-L-arabinose transferase